MRDAAVTMLGRTFVAVLVFALVIVSRVRMVVTTVLVMVERLVKHHMRERNDVEA